MFCDRRKEKGRGENLPGQFNYMFDPRGCLAHEIYRALLPRTHIFFLFLSLCSTLSLAEILMLPFYLGSVGLFILVGTRESARNGGLHLTIYNILSSLITGGPNESRSCIESSLLWNHCTLLYWHAILSGVPPCRYLGTKAFRRNF